MAQPQDLQEFNNMSTGTEDIYPGLYEQDDDLADMDLPSDQVVNDFGEQDLGSDGAVEFTDSYDQDPMEGEPEGSIKDTMPPEDSEDAPSEDVDDTDVAETEAEAETEVEESEAEEVETSDKPDVVPTARLDKEVRRRKAEAERAAELEKRLAELEGEGGQVEIDLANDIKAFQDSLLDGDTENSGQLLNSLITKAVQAGATSVLANLDTRVQAAAARSSQTMTVDEVVAEISSTYEVFNTQSENFDAGLTARANGLAQGYVHEGYDPATALERAAEDAIRMYRPDLIQVAPASGPSKKEVVQRQRREDAVQKRVETTNRQPPKLDTSSAGAQDNFVDPMSLSDKEFKALSERELARARGDYL